MIKTVNEKAHLKKVIDRYSLKPNIIFDCGSRDALDGIELMQLFSGSELHCFECNPNSVKVCEKNLKDHLGENTQGISWFLNDLAVSDCIGEIIFRPINTLKTVTTHPDGNPGASSIFPANRSYKKEQYVQDTITVASITLSEYCKNHQPPDLLWMDLQGAELLALKGAIEILDKIKVVYLEVGFREMYNNQPLFYDLNNFLTKNGFVLKHLDIGRWPKLIKIYHFFGIGPWIGNAVYVNKRDLLENCY